MVKSAADGDGCGEVGDGGATVREFNIVLSMSRLAEDTESPDVEES